MPIVGVPKTIDNDIVGTDVTFGFHTAVQIATDAIDRLHTTAESHDRVMVVEVMGRHSGWIATYAGIAGGATMVLIPEIPFDIEEICRRLSRRHERNRFASIVVVAEGAEPVPGTLEVEEKTYDRFGHVLLGGISDVIAREIADRTGFETRVVMLGHVQRGGTPTAYDRVLCTRLRRRRDQPRPRARLGADGRGPRQRDRAGAAVARRRPDQARRPGALRRRPGLLRLIDWPRRSGVGGLLERHRHPEERACARTMSGCVASVIRRACSPATSRPMAVAAKRVRWASTADAPLSARRCPSHSPHIRKSTVPTSGTPISSGVGRRRDGTGRRRRVRGGLGFGRPDGRV